MYSDTHRMAFLIAVVYTLKHSLRRHKYVYVLHCRTLIYYVRQKLTNLKDNIQVTIIIGDVNTSFSLIVRTSKQEANQSAKDIS